MGSLLSVSGQGRCIGRPDTAGGMTIKASSEQTGGAITVVASRRPTGATGGPGEQIHHAGHESCRVRAGADVFSIAGRMVRVPRGTFIVVPKGTRHRFRDNDEQQIDGDTLRRYDG